jgi:hypothetical protein
MGNVRVTGQSELAMVRAITELVSALELGDVFRPEIISRFPKQNTCLRRRFRRGYLLFCLYGRHGVDRLCLPAPD